MEDIIRFVIRHRIIVSIIFVIIIFVAWLVSFFLSNSLILLTVTSDTSRSGSSVRVEVDDKYINTVISSETSLITIPRSSNYISVSTNEYSTLTNLDVPLFIDSKDINLKPHQATSLANTSGNDCYYQRGSDVISWQCNALEFNVRKTSYSSESFPLQSSVDLGDQYLEYAQKYRDGFLALSNLDGIGVNYVDLSGDKPAITTVDLGVDYIYETTQVIVDSKNSDNFVVLDNQTLKYSFYKDDLTKPYRSGRLPSNFKLVDSSSLRMSLEDSLLSGYIGYSSDNLDDHSVTDKSLKTSQSAKLATYSLDESKLVSQKQVDDLSCENIVTTNKSLACIDRDIVSIYRADKLSDPILRLANSSQIFSYGGEIYVSQKSSIYKYDDATNSLNAVFKVANRSIASSYINNGKLYVSAWYTYPDDRQRTLAYQVDLAKTGKNPAIVKAFPFDISVDLAYGSDVYGKNIYVRLIDDNSDNQSKVRQILKSANVLDDYRLVFD